MESQPQEGMTRVQVATLLKPLVERREWQSILNLTDDPKLTSAYARALLWRLTAAAALDDDARINDTVRKVAATEMDDRIKYACVSELWRTRRANEAVTILLDSPELAGQPQFLQFLARYRDKVSGDTRTRLLEVLEVQSKGGDQIIQEPSAFHFLSLEHDTFPSGTTAVARAAHVSDSHREAFTTGMTRFRSGLAAPIQPQISEYRDVFVDRWGQIWTEAGAVIRSFGRPIPECTRGSVPSVAIGLNLLKATRGIYHWLIDRVPLMAWLVSPQEHDASGVRILLKEDAPQFEIDTIKLAGLSPDRVAFVGDAVFVERLILAEVGFRGMVGWSHLDPILSPIVRNAEAQAGGEGFESPRRLFISRGNAARRPIDNGADLETAMAERGFLIQDFAEIPLWQQIAMVSQAETIVAPHGAGLSHLLFAKGGTRVIEVIPIIEGTYQLRFNYARLSILRGLDYAAWLEEQPTNTDRWSATLDEFLPFLDDRLGG